MLKTKLPNQVEIGRNELATFLVCSVRYSLGRMSYIVDTISQLVNKYKKVLTDDEKHVILQSIKDQEYYGMDMDKETWMKLKTILEEYLSA